MLNPSKPLVISIAVAAFVLLALGLATDVGLIGWTLAALLAIYLLFVGVRRWAGSTRGVA
ncbi:MAG TPA: hypothetical protein VN449_10240 [Gaiellaceae bacterium]|jgi:hypothetical protein|nr:hypothetical protein [Gaiellaceae bacterium]